MEYPQRTDTHYVRCLKCKKILKCSRYDTSTLLDHIRSDHPEIEIIDSSSHKQGENTNEMDKAQERLIVQAEKLGKMLSDIKICNAAEEDDAKVIYTRRYQVNSPELPQSPHRRKLYRTSIEKWRPAKGSIYCPKCGVRKPPLIKTKAERYSTNECGAACLLGCWPFCFLPCLFPGDNKEYLHCANCRNFLGLYDREFNCIKPNREFVEQTNERSSAKSETSSKGESELPKPVDCDDEDDDKDC